MVIEMAYEISAASGRQGIKDGERDNEVTAVKASQRRKRRSKKRSNAALEAPDALANCIPQQESEVTTSENPTVQHRSSIRLWDTFP